MSHESLKLLFVGAMLNCGDGVVCETQMPPARIAATSLLPSAELATETQFVLGTLFDVQVTPKSVEV